SNRTFGNMKRAVAVPAASMDAVNAAHASFIQLRNSRRGMATAPPFTAAPVFAAAPAVAVAAACSTCGCIAAAPRLTAAILTITTKITTGIRIPAEIAIALKTSAIALPDFPARAGKSPQNDFIIELQPED